MMAYDSNSQDYTSDQLIHFLAGRLRDLEEAGSLVGHLARGELDAVPVSSADGEERAASRAGITAPPNAAAGGTASVEPASRPRPTRPWRARTRTNGSII